MRINYFVTDFFCLVFLQTNLSLLIKNLLIVFYQSYIDTKSIFTVKEIKINIWNLFIRIKNKNSFLIYYWFFLVILKKLIKFSVNYSSGRVKRVSILIFKYVHEILQTDKFF